MSGRSFTSTEAQNNFGQLLSLAKREGHVFITKHSRPEAVLLSIEEYEALAGKESVDLLALEREFDLLFEKMQRPAQRQAVDRLFQMGAGELGRAALSVFASDQ